MCPLCQKGASLNFEPDFRFTSWNEFKKHFCKHCQADLFVFNYCNEEVSLNLKSLHFEIIHNIYLLEKGMNYITNTISR